jgi:hypothetical protein
MPAATGGLSVCGALGLVAPLEPVAGAASFLQPAAETASAAAIIQDFLG